MSFFSNYNPIILGVYDNELYITYFPPNNNGKVIGRTSLENVHHSGGAPEEHPTLSKVIKNTSGHVFLNGSFTFEWQWPDGDITEQEIDEYIDLVNSTTTPGLFTVSKDINKIVLALSDANFAIPDWSDQTLPWHPKAPYAKITNTSDVSEYICVTRLNGIYNQYTFDQRTIEPNETIQFDRPIGEKCFILFTGDVTKGVSTLLKHRMYKMTSSSIEVTNTGTERIKVLRYTKGIE